MPPKKDIPQGLKDWLAKPENIKKRQEAVAKNKAVRAKKAEVKKAGEKTTFVVDKVAYAKHLKDMSQANEDSRKGIISSLGKDRLYKAKVWTASVKINKKDPMTKFYKMLEDTGLGKTAIKRLIDLIPRDMDVDISVFGDQHFCVVFMEGTDFYKALISSKPSAFKNDEALALERFVVILKENYGGSGGFLTNTGDALDIVNKIIKNNLLTAKQIGDLATYVNKEYNDRWFQEGIKSLFL
jgi:hypothetical protein